MAGKDKWVRRFSVDETSRHKNGFTIYKITSVLFLIESPEAVTVVSVWKRYSDVQRLHKSMRLLHAGLHLRGTFPTLVKSSYFKRFQAEVIDERAKMIKSLLEFIAEHKLLFTSTDFVNFLQTGYPEPESSSGGVINAIRSSLHLPLEEAAPLEYPTSDDDSRSPPHPAESQPNQSTDEIDYISQIPIYEAADVELPSPEHHKLSKSDSFESINSLESIDSDLYTELDKVAIDKKKSFVKKQVLPDLIDFDAPSTSRLDESMTDTTSLSSTVYGGSQASCRSAIDSCKTEDSYVFEAGYMLNLAARYERAGEYQRAFDCYKAGIEKMLIGAQTDTDAGRRSLLREKTRSYLAHAERLHRAHLTGNTTDIDLFQPAPRPQCALPLRLLRRPVSELRELRPVRTVAPRLLLVLHRGDHTCRAMKVIEKVPNNLTEFDEYFLQNTNETRQPVLPTNVPYMVPLHYYIETNDLYFLLLSYAPGEKLFDYIKNYTKSAPTTPSREVNLENVIAEPIANNNSSENVSAVQSASSVRVDNNNSDELSVNELVKNSQKLLEDVDRVLSDSDVKVGAVEAVEVEKAVEIPRFPACPPRALPPSTIRLWAAELLTALESLHNAGVICRDLNPSNILLGSRGQVLLTYMQHAPGRDMRLAALRRGAQPYAAPELWDPTGEREDVTADYWSYGAILYELFCGVPLSATHGRFQPHTLLHLPAELRIDERELLTQLLTYSPEDRLGSGVDGIEEIKRHPYFRHVQWADVYDNWARPD